MSDDKPKGKGNGGRVKADEAIQIPEGWKKLPLRRFRYAPEGGPARLELLGVERGESEFGPYTAVIGLATGDCPVFDLGEDGKPQARVVPAGFVVMVILTAGNRALEAVALDAQFIHEVLLVPAGTQRTPRGVMKLFEGYVSPSPRPRTNTDGAGIMMPSLPGMSATDFVKLPNIADPKALPAPTGPGDPA